MKKSTYSLTFAFLGALLLNGCSSNGAEDQMVIFDEKSGAVTFANKKYNEKLAAREAKKWDDRKTLYQSKTGINPVTGEKEIFKEDDQNARYNSNYSGFNGMGYYNEPNGNIRYNTQEPTDYETYKQWRAARGIENSPEYQRFKLWQEFEEFQRWKASQQPSRTN